MDGVGRSILDGGGPNSLEEAKEEIERLSDALADAEMSALDNTKALESEQKKASKALDELKVLAENYKLIEHKVADTEMKLALTHELHENEQNDAVLKSKEHSLYRSHQALRRALETAAVLIRKAGDEKKAAKDSQQYAELNMTKAQRDVVMLTEIVDKNERLSANIARTKVAEDILVNARDSKERSVVSLARAIDSAITLLRSVINPDIDPAMAKSETDILFERLQIQERDITYLQCELNRLRSQKCETITKTRKGKATKKHPYDTTLYPTAEDKPLRDITTPYDIFKNRLPVREDANEGLLTTGAPSKVASQVIRKRTPYGVFVPGKKVIASTGKKKSSFWPLPSVGGSYPLADTQREIERSKGRINVGFLATV